MSEFSDAIDAEEYKRQQQDIENQNFATDHADILNAVDPTHLPPSPTPIHLNPVPENPQPSPEPDPNNQAPPRPNRTLEEARTRQQRFERARLSRMEFNDRLISTGLRSLYGRDDSENVISYNITLSTLQRMVIHELQRKLVLNVKGIVRNHEVTEASMKTAHELLAEYTNAIRDYDFMTEKLIQTTAIGERDPFLITTKDTLGQYLMKDAGLVPEDDHVQALDRKRYREQKNILPGSSRTIHNDNISFSLLWERLWMGVCGGLALIAPMLLMVLHKDEITTLATTSVATMLFALGLAVFGRKLKGQEVLASVAAYAAVLVVFVGTSS